MISESALSAPRIWTLAGQGVAESDARIAAWQSRDHPACRWVTVEFRRQRERNVERLEA